MRSTVKAAFITLALWGLLVPLQGQGRLTIVAGFDQLPDAAVVEGMQQEAGELFSDAALTFSWQPLQDNFAGVPGPFVSVQFHGKCARFRPRLAAPWLGFSLRMVKSNRSSRWTAAAMVWQNRGTMPLPLVTRAFGRAVGRVLAHELYHYFTQSSLHTASELFRHAMTSKDLTMPQTRFESGEIEAIRKGMSKLGVTPQWIVSNSGTE